MVRMAQKQTQGAPTNWRTDWWLWPLALFLVLCGWGQAIWIWEHIPPDGLAPLWLLLAAAVGAAGLSIPVYWLAVRWWQVAVAAAVTWLGVPLVNKLVQDHFSGALSQPAWLYAYAPLLLLSLLGLGLSGTMMTISWYIARDQKVAARDQKVTAPGVWPLREGLWTGLFVMVCGWLLVNRAFNIGAIALLASGLVLLEAYILIHGPTEAAGAKSTRKPSG
jgi:hypothetical protein